LASCDKTTCRTTEDFQNMSDEIGQRFGAAQSETDVQKRGNNSNQNSVQNEA
jgi:hypothetical protein